LTSKEAQQYLVANVQYALSAIVWGSENGYRGFAEEGRKALRLVGKMLD
jgi:hypothetical protein